MYLFIERIKKIKQVDFIRVNLWMNFRDTVFEWWTTELFDTEKRKNGKNVDEWFTLLIFKFKKTFIITIGIILHEKYRMKNAINKQKTREFAQKSFIRLKTLVIFKSIFFIRYHLSISNYGVVSAVLAMFRFSIRISQI